MASSKKRLAVLSARTVHTSSGQTIAAMRLWVALAFSRQGGARHLRKCLLDTGAPLSVVPYSVHHAQNLTWQALPGPWPPGFTSWLGVPCAIGRMEVWAPDPQASRFHGPWMFIAKFALATPANQPPNLPVLLGLNFLADHHADTRFRCHATGTTGSILIP